MDRKQILDKIRMSKEEFETNIVSKARKLNFTYLFDDDIYDKINLHFSLINTDQFSRILNTIPVKLKDEIIQKKIYLPDIENYENGKRRIVIFYSKSWCDSISATREERRIFIFQQIARYLIKLVYPEIHRYSYREKFDQELYTKIWSICDAFCLKEFTKDDIIASLQKLSIYSVKSTGIRIKYKNDLDELDSIMRQTEQLAQRISHLSKRIENLVFGKYFDYWKVEYE